MAEVSETDYLSIGEVLGLLLEEFPDVTISKIRFLESQGLISPERTPSGYRKFYDADVDLLRVILTEQRQNYLPLRVIKDRLETGEIDPTGEHLRPDEEEPDAPVESPAPAAAQASVAPSVEPGSDDEAIDDEALDDEAIDDDATPTEVPAAAIRAHPAARHAAARASEPEPASFRPPAREPAAREPAPAPARLLPGVLLDRSEFLSMVGIEESELEQLESFGVVTPRTSSGAPVYDEDTVAIAKPAVEFLRAGIDARHLRNWRTSADREASLYEQLVTPRFRQRNPESRAEALQQLRRLDDLGAQLRSALTHQALRHHFDG